MRILLAVDASPDSKNAAQMIRHFAEPPALDVLNVVDEDALKHAYISPEMPANYLEAYRKEVSEASERILHEMRDELAEHCSHVRLIADTGDAADSIIHTSEESQSELIIVGQRGMTATPSFLLGGVSQKVATYAPCSVLVVKESAAVLERIVLAVDGSDESHKAVQFFARCAFKGTVQVTIVTVWPERRMEALGKALGGRGRADMEDLVEQKGEELLHRIADELGTRHYEIATEILHGDPAFAILESAVRHDAHMIALGSRGMKAIKRFLLGSVCQKVLVYSTCSVLVVR